MPLKSINQCSISITEEEVDFNAYGNNDDYVYTKYNAFNNISCSENMIYVYLMHEIRSKIVKDLV